MEPSKLTAVILTYNEEQHLPRCLTSLKGVADSVLVVDCFSTDATVSIAEEHGAKVVQHSWTNHSTQFNWALGQIETTEWILRLDADE
ncbi:glycosyltransferase family 2 protein, partial [Desulfomarina sp.]